MKTRAEKIPETAAAISRSAETQGSGDTPVPNSSHARFSRPGFRDTRGRLRVADHVVVTAPRGSTAQSPEGTPQVASAARDNRVRFYLPLVPDDPEQPVWSVIRKIADKIGEGVTTHLRAIAKQNPLLEGIIDRVDFNATTHGQRDLDDDRLSNLIEAISTKRLGLADVEADIIGKSYEPSGASQSPRQGSPKCKRGGAYQYLIRNFAEGGGQSAGEWRGATWTAIGRPEGERGGAHQFYTPGEVGDIVARVLDPEPGMEIYDPTCGSGGLLLCCIAHPQEGRRSAAGSSWPTSSCASSASARFLADGYLQRVVRAYQNFKDEPGFTRVVPIGEIRAKEGNLSVPLYVGGESHAQTDEATTTATTALPVAFEGWLNSSAGVRAALRNIMEVHS